MKQCSNLLVSKLHTSREDFLCFVQDHGSKKVLGIWVFSVLKVKHSIGFLQISVVKIFISLFGESMRWAAQKVRNLKKRNAHRFSKFENAKCLEVFSFKTRKSHLELKLKSTGHINVTMYISYLQLKWLVMWWMTQLPVLIGLVIQEFPG